MNGLISSSLASLPASASPTCSSSLSESSEEPVATGHAQMPESMMALLRENLKCKICFELFDNDRRRPVILSSCGHTYCMACMLRIYKTTPLPKSTTATIPLAEASGSSKKKKHMPSCPCCGKKIDKKIKELTLNWSIMAIIDDTKMLSFKETCDQFKCKYDEYQSLRSQTGNYFPDNLAKVREEISESASKAVCQIEAQKKELLGQIDALEQELAKSKITKKIEKLNKKLDNDLALVTRKLNSVNLLNLSAAANQINDRELKKLNERIDDNLDFMKQMTRLLSTVRNLKMVEFKENATRRDLLADKSFLGDLVHFTTPFQVSSLLEQALPYSDFNPSPSMATLAKLDDFQSSKQHQRSCSDQLPVLTASSLIPLDPSSLDLFATISNGF